MSAKRKRNIKTLFTRIITFILALTMTITPLTYLDTNTTHVHAVEEYKNGGPIITDGEAIIP